MGHPPAHSAGTKHDTIMGRPDSGTACQCPLPTRPLDSPYAPPPTVGFACWGHGRQPRPSWPLSRPNPSPQAPILSRSRPLISPLCSPPSRPSYLATAATNSPPRVRSSPDRWISRHGSRSTSRLILIVSPFLLSAGLGTSDLDLCSRSSPAALVSSRRLLSCLLTSSSALVLRICR